MLYASAFDGLGYLKAVALLMAACALSGCEEGTDLTFTQARSYLALHEQGLRTLMHKVEGCRPVFSRDGNYHAIRLSDGSDPACTAGGASVVDIKANMRKLGVVVLSFDLDESHTVTTADFCLFRAGLAVSGRSLSIVYVKAPSTLDDAKTPDPLYDGKAELIGRFILKSGADNWYWDRSVD